MTIPLVFFSRRFLVKNLNSEYSAASVLTSLLSGEHQVTYLWSQSQSLYDWRFTTNQFVLATSPLRLTTSNFFQLNTCSHSPYAIHRDL
jgi:hypothetical protein